MRSQCRRLARFIRLIDFITVDCFHDLAVASTEAILGLITAPQGDVPLPLPPRTRSVNVGLLSESMFAATPDLTRKPLFSVEVHVDLSGWEQGGEQGPRMGLVLSSAVSIGSEDDAFGPGSGALAGISFRPQPESFKQVLSCRVSWPNACLSCPYRAVFVPQRLVGIVFEGVRSVAKPTRWLTHDEFALFAFPSIDESGPIGDGLDLEMMIMEDPSFQKSVESINALLTDAFDDVRAHWVSWS
jgi:hypothetical protein